MKRLAVIVQYYGKQVHHKTFVLIMIGLAIDVLYYGKQIHHKMISDQEMTCRSSVYGKQVHHKRLIVTMKELAVVVSILYF